MIKTGIPATSIVFLDIETVPIVQKMYELSKQPALAVAWNNVHENKYKNELNLDGKPMSAQESFASYAALYPEFGKIVCISLGYFEGTQFHVKAFCHKDEYQLLTEVSEELVKRSVSHKIIGGWNIKNFDIPFMVRRATINNFNLDTRFDYFSKKPWEMVDFLDIMEVWKAGANYLGSCTLESVCAAFGFKSPKEDMNGKMVSTCYYLPSGPDFARIGQYCNGDVVSTACAYVRMTKGYESLKQVTIASNIF